jgi:hypothetical protein
MGFLSMPAGSFQACCSSFVGITIINPLEASEVIQKQLFARAEFYLLPMEDDEVYSVI